MASDAILGSEKLIAFVPTRDLARARRFYELTLGLRLGSDEAPVALVFDGGGTMLRITAVGDYTPDAFTVLGWQVDSIEKTVDRLASAGVAMLRYSGMNDSEPRGIWTSPAGACVAWFHDPDRNVLSVTEFPKSEK
ncbi:MAG TPA: VOC family protein [Terracidiphilus sp.]|nr:VOC family protein [Terracidiphilus sp.]